MLARRRDGVVRRAAACSLVADVTGGSIHDGLQLISQGPAVAEP